MAGENRDGCVVLEVLIKSLWIKYERKSRMETKALFECSVKKASFRTFSHIRGH